MRRRFICRGRRWIPLAFTFRRRRGISMREDFIASYRGILILLMQKHLEFQIVTPRTLAEFHGQDAGVAGCPRAGGQREELDAEFCWSGESSGDHGDGRYGDWEFAEMSCGFAHCPGRAYNAELEKDFEHASPDSQQAFLSSLRGGEHGAGQSRDAGGDVDRPDFRWSRQCFLCELCRAAWRVNPVQTPQTGSRLA